MARSHHSTMNWLQGVHGARTQKAIHALIQGETNGYETTTASGAATGLNSPNRMRNSATLTAEPNLIVGVKGQTFYRIQGVLGLALTAANGIKLDFNAGTATIKSGTMGGAVEFYTAGSSNFATAVGATNGIPLLVPLTALNTAVSGGTTNTWVLIKFDWTALFDAGGSVQLQFAQASAGATNTDILPGSFIRAIPLDHQIA